MQDAPEDNGTGPLPADLRFLKRLVTILTAVMIVGVVTICTLLVIRLNATAPPVLLSPDIFELPAGVEVTGYSQSGEQIVIVGSDGVIRVFDAVSRAQTHEFDPSVPGR